MIQIMPQMKILLCVEAVDFRKGIDGMSQVCRQRMKSDPFSGYVFVFRNKRKTSLKVLSYDGQGFWICQKRLSKGRFRWWPEKQTDKVSELAVHELQMLIWNGSPESAKVAPLWKKIRN